MESKPHHRALAIAIAGLGLSAPGLAAAVPIVAPGVTLGSVAADFQPESATQQSPPQATWSTTFSELTEFPVDAYLRLTYTVNACDWSPDAPFLSPAYYSDVYQLVSGPAVTGDSAEETRLCGNYLREGNAYPRLRTWLVPLDAPKLRRNQTRTAFLATRNAYTRQDTPIGQFRIRYEYKQLTKRKTVRIWQGTDAYWNVCVRGKRDVYMQGGRRYCDNVTDARWRVRLSFVGPRVLGG